MRLTGQRLSLNSCFLTMRFDAENQIQYLIGRDMNISEFELISNKKLPKDIKEIIKQAYEMTKNNKLSDFLN